MQLGWGPSLCVQLLSPQASSPGHLPSSGIFSLQALRGLGSRPSFTCCKVAFDTLGASVNLSFFFMLWRPKVPSCPGILPWNLCVCTSLPLGI